MTRAVPPLRPPPPICTRCPSSLSTIQFAPARRSGRAWRLERGPGNDPPLRRTELFDDTARFDTHHTTLKLSAHECVPSFSRKISHCMGGGSLKEVIRVRHQLFKIEPSMGCSRSSAVEAKLTIFASSIEDTLCTTCASSATTAAASS
jgi:hypothetical protein